MPHVIRQVALDCGVEEDRIEIFPEPRAATRHALDDARGGDLLVLLALTQRQESLALVHEFIGDRAMSQAEDG